MSFGPIVDAAWLHRHIEDADLRVIDFRWYLQGRNGHEEFRRGHIPHAVFLDLERVSGKEGGGRHPLPSAAQFESEMRASGVDGAMKVVVYDDVGGTVASRLWFLLRYFGHRQQAVLDGGLQAWGEPVVQVVEQFRAGDFTAKEPDRSLVLHVDDVQQLRGVPLIDARAAERYRGEKEPVDPKAGHVPGALNMPFTGNLGQDGRFKNPDELRAQYERAGATNGAVFYCGSGVNATHHVLAMEVAGLPDAKIYAGSWSDWSNRDLPVAVGPEP
jgi:thiosulfate/3-mercaptopyruvate sulfurtransferase